MSQPYPYTPQPPPAGPYQPPAWPPAQRGYAPPPPRGRHHIGLIVTICVLAAALIAGGGLLAYSYFQPKDDPIAPVAPGMATTPQAAVRGYLRALAASDSAAALSFGETTPPDTTFLTDQVLAVLNANGPITSINAVKDPSSTKTSALVDATYDMGGNPIQARFQVDLMGKYYKIQQVAAAVDLEGAALPGIGLKVAGVDTSYVSAGYVYMFPGVYPITLENKLLELTGDTEFTITDPAAYVAPNITVALADDAQAAFAAATTAALKSCITEKTSLTSCGFGSTLGEDNSTGQLIIPQDGTVKWALAKGSSESFAKDTFVWSADNPTMATAAINVNLDITFTANNGHRYSGTYNLYQATVDFSAPDHLVATILSS